MLNEEFYMIVKDEYFIKKIREEMLVIIFDDSVLDYINLDKYKKFIIFFKNSFWIVFRKFMNFGCKGKLMLVIFMISGMLVVFVIINMYSIFIKDYKDVFIMDECYI